VTDSNPFPSGVVPSAVVELNRLSTSAALGAFYRLYLEFILRRVVHDLGNSVSGINSLSDYHLRSGVNDPGLEESLGLIRESAEHSRDVLIIVADLLQPPETAEEFIRPSELIGEASKIATILLPRSVRLEIAEGQDDGSTGFSVVRGEFLRRFLALAAMDVSHLRIASGQICLGWDRDGARIRLFYRSKFNPPSELRSQASVVMEEVSRQVEVSSSWEGEELTISLYFPVMQLAGPE